MKCYILFFLIIIFCQMNAMECDDGLNEILTDEDSSACNQHSLSASKIIKYSNKQKFRSQQNNSKIKPEINFLSDLGPCVVGNYLGFFYVFINELKANYNK